MKDVTSGIPLLLTGMAYVTRMSLLRSVKLVIVIVMLTLWIVLSGDAHLSRTVAQGTGGSWTQPITIVETEGQLMPGAMASDSAGNLHVLFTNTPDESLPLGIEYLYWNGVEWSAPVSVLINANGANTWHPRLRIDRHDRMHVVWVDGAFLYYASSPTATAASAHSWSSPVVIGQAILTPIDLAIGPHDDLYVAFSDSSQTGQVSLVTSTDAGQTWSTPTAIAQTAQGTVPGDVRLALDDSGRLHATWTVYSLAEGNTAFGISYTHTMENRITEWAIPIEVAGPRHGQAGIVTVGDDEVHLVWRSNIGGDGTFHQWSSDGGTNWSDPDHFDDRGGFSGLAHLVVDSLQRVHYTIGPVFYTIWSEGRLDPYQDIATTAVREAATVSNGEAAILSITHGNRLHVLFETDFNKLWYTTKVLEAPEVLSPTVEVAQSALEPQPTIPSASGISAVIEPDDPTPSASNTPPIINDRQQTTSSTYSPILLGIAPAVVLVTAVFLVQQTRRRR